LAFLPNPNSAGIASTTLWIASNTVASAIVGEIGYSPGYFPLTIAFKDLLKHFPDLVFGMASRIMHTLKQATGPISVLIALTRAA